MQRPRKLVFEVELAPLFIPMRSKVTLKEVAEALGVSTMTVSRAMNNSDKISQKTKEVVRRKAKEMGYTPNQIAKSLISQKTNTIGVVIPEIHHMFFSQVVSGIESVMFENKYQLFLTNSSEQFSREKDAIEALQSRRVDGLLISCAEDSNDIHFYKSLVHSGTKVVFFDRCIENIGASCVSVKDRMGAQEATQHLIDQGYRRIAHLAGTSNQAISRERQLGYEDALLVNGLEAFMCVKVCGFAEQAGYQAMKELLEEDDLPLDAVFTVNDPVAFGAIKAIREKGLRIPEDIALIGFSDDIRAELMPTPLSTVSQPAFQIGKRAAEKLIRAIEHSDEPVESIYMNTQLIIRESSGSKDQKGV